MENQMNYLQPDETWTVEPAFPADLLNLLVEVVVEWLVYFASFLM